MFFDTSSADPEDWDLHLRPESLCIDGGTNTPSEGLPDGDIEGSARIVDGDNDGIMTVDMGAYEGPMYEEPVIRLSGHDFLFTAVEDEYDLADKVLTIRNGGGGTLSWQITENCPWLKVSTKFGESTGEIDEVVISVNISGLSDGFYSYTLEVADSEAINSPQLVEVTLIIRLETNILTVPGMFPTIQSAVDAAVDGDTVLVADGIYTGEGNRDIIIEKAITVRSATGAENCIIDCEGTETDQHRGFNIVDIVSESLVIKGFTIVNGYIYEEGGAIFCSNSSVLIDECILSNNTGRYGGGIYFEESDGKFDGCSFTGNTAGTYGGGGVYCRGEGDFEIIDCEFIGNNANGDGGGLAFWADVCTIRDCRFESNTAGGWGGAINSSYEGSSTIDNCKIVSNEAGAGGGVFIVGGRITNCIIRDNTTDGVGGGIFGFDLCVDNCLIVGNEAEHSGGGIRATCDQSFYRISNCTIVGNVAWYTGGGISVNGSYGVGSITNSIIWGNGGYEGRELNIWYAPVVIDNCNIGTDEWDIHTEIDDFDLGDNSIDAEPEFADAYYFDPNVEPEDPYYGLLILEDAHLKAGSPCVDKGCNDTVIGLERFDIDGQVRLLDGNGDGEAVVDMGAYEFAPEGAPIIATDEERIYFTCYESGERTGEESLKIYNTGAGVLEWELTEECDWLGADIYSGFADANGIEVTFTVDATGLETGVYTCEIQILDEGAVNSPAVVTAVLYVVPDAGLWVPFHYETIQAAVDAAVDFEMVLVADGTYTGDGNRDIYVNKQITIKSATDAEHCVVDVQGADNSRGFYLDGVDPNCVLEGLTISGGSWPPPPGGAGIYCAGSAVIRDCVITNNVMFNGSGGGIYFEGKGGRVEGCVIRGNAAEYRGGGIYCYSGSGGELEIIDSVISENFIIEYGSSNAHGSGVHCAYCDLSIINSRIERNRGAISGGGVYARSGINVLVSDSVINNNSAGQGGGIYFYEDCDVEISGSTFNNNSGVRRPHIKQ
jgi:hypothetical protein